MPIQAHTVYLPGTNTMRETFPDGTRVFEVEGFMSQPDADVPEPRDDVNLPGCKWPDPVPAPHFPWPRRGRRRGARLVRFLVTYVTPLDAETEILRARAWPKTAAVLFTNVQ